DEVVVNESFLAEHGVRLGDVVDVATITWDEFRSGLSAFGEPAGTVVPMRIVGVVRTASDLTVAVGNNNALSVSQAVVALGPQWVERVGYTSFARYRTGVAIDVRPGADLIAVARRVEPDRLAYVSDESLVEGELAGLEDAIAYEARATWMAAGLVALAVVVFVGQMVARQARREVDDAEALRAMGATTGTFVRSCIPRWAVTAAIAVTGATVVGAVGRTFGPNGVARSMLGRSSPGLNWGLAPAVLAGLAALILGTGLGATARASRRRAPDRWARRWTAAPPMPTAASAAGLSWLSPGSARGRGQAPAVVAGLAVAVAAAVASASLVASLRHLTAEPDRYGAPWHAVVTSALGSGSSRYVADRLASLDGVDAVAGVVGDDGSIGDHSLYVYSLMPVTGLRQGIEPIVVRGRPPSSAGEVALGAKSLAAVHASLGDTVELSYKEHIRRLTVVGEVLVYDNWEPVPGVGALVDHQLIDEIDPAPFVSDYAVRFQPGDETAGVAALRASFPRLVTAPTVPGAVRNLQRVSSWPALLTLIVGLLALSGFVHALVVMVRRQRGQLAVLQALGFRRRQLSATVSWYATALVVPALVIGVPLGVVAGRWGWGVFAADLGVPPVANVPLLALLAIVVVAFAVVNVVTLPVAWRAAHRDLAQARRAE
ncbi:MAG TPA: FtsX-like permease family protein, partial [Acidimicrobiales bacterium]